MFFSSDGAMLTFRSVITIYHILVLRILHGAR